jgi:hypothetical protein
MREVPAQLTSVKLALTMMVMAEPPASVTMQAKVPPLL